MIQSLRICGLKCYADQTIPFGKITLLAGANAAGKSTVIQSLLLLRQSSVLNVLQAGQLLLKGPLTNVGTAGDARNQLEGADRIDFDLQTEYLLSFHFEIPKGDPQNYVLLGVPGAEVPDLGERGLFGDWFVYLSAERLGPRLMYPTSEQLERFSAVGVQGELVPHVLARYQGERVANTELAERLRDSQPSAKLLHQARGWMRELIPGVDFVVEELHVADQVRIGVRNHSVQDYVRPTNTGFGVMYSMPIVIGALMSPPGSLMIIENPEAHLHPAAQSRMGYLLAQVAASGVQVIVETHSDHVLNGLRRAVKKEVLQPHDVSLLAFTARHNASPLVQSVRIYTDGGMEPPIPGFFDQIDNDMMELF